LGHPGEGVGVGRLLGRQAGPGEVQLLGEEGGVPRQGLQERPHLGGVGPVRLEAQRQEDLQLVVLPHRPVGPGPPLLAPQDLGLFRLPFYPLPHRPERLAHPGVGEVGPARVAVGPGEVARAAAEKPVHRLLPEGLQLLGGGPHPDRAPRAEPAEDDGLVLGRDLGVGPRGEQPVHPLLHLPPSLEGVEGPGHLLQVGQVPRALDGEPLPPEDPLGRLPGGNLLRALPQPPEGRLRYPAPLAREEGGLAGEGWASRGEVAKWQNSASGLPHAIPAASRYPPFLSSWQTSASPLLGRKRAPLRRVPGSRRWSVGLPPPQGQKEGGGAAGEPGDEVQECLVAPEALLEKGRPGSQLFGKGFSLSDHPGPSHGAPAEGLSNGV
jgi:hypothetical protein